MQSWPVLILQSSGLPWDYDGSNWDSHSCADHVVARWYSCVYTYMLYTHSIWSIRNRACTKTQEHLLVASFSQHCLYGIIMNRACTTCITKYLLHIFRLQHWPCTASGVSGAGLVPQSGREEMTESRFSWGSSYPMATNIVRSCKNIHFSEHSNCDVYVWWADLSYWVRFRSILLCRTRL